MPKKIKATHWTFKVLASKQEYQDEFVALFLETLNDYGDEYFGEPDFEDIAERFKTQGYWAGSSVRYYWNELTASFDVRPRVFGG